MALASICVFFGVTEIALRQLGFARTAPITLQFNGFDPLKDVTVDDPAVLWRFRANDDVSFSGFHFTTNAIGTRGYLPELAKSKDTLRVICLGDSTAFGNWLTYPEQLQSILAEHSDSKIEVINAGIPGFTSHQGYQLFLHDLAAYQPDIVTWCFGFNNAKESVGGVPDVARLAALQTTLGRLRFELSRLRFFRVLENWIIDLRPHTRAFSEQDRDFPLRCPPAEHAELLRKMAEWAENHEITFIPITQPHGIRTAALDSARAGSAEVGRLIRKRLDEQNDAVRSTATELALPILDMAKEFDAITRFDPFLDPFPGKDSIHHNILGIRAFASILAAWLSRSGSIPTREPLKVPHRIARYPFALACDLEGDACDEIVIGTYTDRLELTIVDAQTRVLRRLECPLRAPTRECSIQSIPLLQEPIAVSVATGEGFRIDTLSADGTSGRFHSDFALPGVGSQLIRVLPFDKNSDGRPEYVLDFGRAVADQVFVLSETGQPMTRWSIPFDRGTSLAWTIQRGSAGKELVLLSGCKDRIGTILQAGTKGQPQSRQIIYHQLPDLPCIGIVGEFDLERPGYELMATRGTVLFRGVDPGEKLEFSFPLELAQIDEALPALSATVLQSADRSRHRLLIASANETSVEVLLLDRDGLRPFATIPSP